MKYHCCLRWEISLSVFALTVLQKGSDAAGVDSVRLSNDTERCRIDEMATNV